MSSISPTKRTLSDFFLIPKEKSLSEISKENKKTQEAVAEVFSDSDSEVSDSEDISPPIYSRTGRIRAKQMTINALSWNRQFNIKGGELIQIAHHVVHSIHNRLDRSNKTHENTINEDNTISFQNSYGWIKFLGGWRGRIPTGEFSYHDEDGELQTFTGVKIGNTFFSIKNNRLYYKDKDLTYPQIRDIIEIIKENFNVCDSDFAKRQLTYLSDVTNPKKSLLHFLNALMFGMEATGANVGIITSLMILELIAEGKLTYQEAFCANNDGGIYPYATFGNNEGTYTARKIIIKHPNNMGESIGMKSFRINPHPSPVAVKEAILIKYWLKTKGVIQSNNEHDKQRENIRKSLEKLITDHLAINEEDLNIPPKQNIMNFLRPAPSRSSLK